MNNICRELMVPNGGLFYLFSQSWRGCKNHLWRNKVTLFSVSLFSTSPDVLSNDSPPRPPSPPPPPPSSSSLSSLFSSFPFLFSLSLLPFFSPPQVTYPLLRNKQEWTKADGEHCSAWTQKHPNTCLLDSKWQHYIIMM